MRENSDKEAVKKDFLVWKKCVHLFKKKKAIYLFKKKLFIYKNKNINLLKKI